MMCRRRLRGLWIALACACCLASLLLWRHPSGRPRAAAWHMPRRNDPTPELLRRLPEGRLISGVLRGRAADGKTVLHVLTAYPGRAVNTPEQHVIDQARFQGARGQLTARRHPVVKREAAALHDAIREVLSRVPELANEGDADGDAPLHFAAYNGDEATVGILLRGGAEPNAARALSTRRLSTAPWRWPEP